MNARFTRIDGKWFVATASADDQNTVVLVTKRDGHSESTALGTIIGMHPKWANMWTYEIDRKRGGRAPNAPKATEAPVTHTRDPLDHLDHDDSDGDDMSQFEQTPPSAADDRTASEQAATLANLLQSMLERDAPLDEQRVRELITESASLGVAAVEHMIAEAMPAEQRVTIDLAPANGGDTEPLEGVHHKALPDVLAWLACGTHVYLVGPAGSGKTTLAESAAKALGRDLYITGAMLTKYEVLGYQDGNGQYVTTAARQAYEFGGVLLWDEVDSSQPAALVAVNAMLSNNLYTFPDRTVTRHKDFIVIAAGNTFGRGADREYVGRLQLDGATLDRFTNVIVDYDTTLERALAAAEYRAYGGEHAECLNTYVNTVQAIRELVTKHNVRHIVSPRASIFGARALARGMSETQILEQLVYKGIPADTRAQIEVGGID